MTSNTNNKNSTTVQIKEWKSTSSNMKDHNKKLSKSFTSPTISTEAQTISKDVQTISEVQSVINILKTRLRDQTLTFLDNENPKLKINMNNLVKKYPNFETILPLTTLWIPAIQSRAKGTPRPENCFLLFRKDIHKGLGQINFSFKNVSTISKVISALWELTCKDFWKEFAEIVKERHKGYYPNYKFSPNRNRNKKPRDSTDTKISQKENKIILHNPKRSTSSKSKRENESNNISASFSVKIINNNNSVVPTQANNQYPEIITKQNTTVDSQQTQPILRNIILPDSKGRQSQIVVNSSPASPPAGEHQISDISQVPFQQIDYYPDTTILTQIPTQVSSYYPQDSSSSIQPEIIAQQNAMEQFDISAALQQYAVPDSQQTQLSQLINPPLTLQQQQLLFDFYFPVGLTQYQPTIIPPTNAFSQQNTLLNLTSSLPSTVGTVGTEFTEPYYPSSHEDLVLLGGSEFIDPLLLNFDPYVFDYDSFVLEKIMSPVQK